MALEDSLADEPPEHAHHVHAAPRVHHGRVDVQVARRRSHEEAHPFRRRLPADISSTACQERDMGAWGHRHMVRRGHNRASYRDKRRHQSFVKPPASMPASSRNLMTSLLCSSAGLNRSSAARESDNTYLRRTSMVKMPGLRVTRSSE